MPCFSKYKLNKSDFDCNIIIIKNDKVGNYSL